MTRLLWHRHSCRCLPPSEECFGTGKSACATQIILARDLLYCHKKLKRDHRLDTELKLTSKLFRLESSKGREYQRVSIKDSSHARTGTPSADQPGIRPVPAGRPPVKVVCLGGGPAGLYLSILLKKANPQWDVTVVERNRPNDTFGWGIVFSDKTMDGFKSVDEETHAEITRAFRHWDDIDVHFKGRKITSGGHGFCGIARIKLLKVLQKRASSLSVKLVYKTEITDPDDYSAQYDLVIASDGAS